MQPGRNAAIHAGGVCSQSGILRAMHTGFAPVRSVLLLSAVLIFIAASHLRATEAVTFDGGGYHVDILVGQAEKPSIAQVRFSPPGDTEWVAVPHELLRIEKFDDNKRVLILRFVNKDEPKLPRTFSLVVRKESGVLTVDGKPIKGSFDWRD